MALKIKGQVVVDAPRERVWAMLFNADILKEMGNQIPGVSVERLVQTSEDKYEGSAILGVAMIKGKYDGSVTVIERRPPEYVRFRGDGKSGGNWTSGEVALTLADQGNTTLLSYEGTGNVGGMLASVGQRLVDTVGKHFVQYGTQALARELAAHNVESVNQNDKAA